MVGIKSVEALKVYQHLLTTALDTIDKFFDIRIEQFLLDDPSVAGKNYSDLELGRLIDIEKSIVLYTDLIEVIALTMETEQYKQSDLDLQPLLSQYHAKLEDLQLRKELYLSMRKHESDSEEALFNEFMMEYYGLHGELEDWTLAIEDIEEVIIADMMLRYPDFMREVAMQLKERIQGPDLQMDLDGYLTRVLTNIDFISLQSRYRHLNHLDAKRKADTTLSLEESTQAYENILAQKNELLLDYHEFVAQNPNFKALEQPDDSFLVGLPTYTITWVSCNGRLILITRKELYPTIVESCRQIQTSI